MQKCQLDTVSAKEAVSAAMHLESERGPRLTARLTWHNVVTAPVKNVDRNH